MSDQENETRIDARYKRSDESKRKHIVNSTDILNRAAKKIAEGKLSSMVIVGVDLDDPMGFSLMFSTQLPDLMQLQGALQEASLVIHDMWELNSSAFRIDGEDMEIQ
jgi:hypothetical protein